MSKLTRMDQETSDRKARSPGELTALKGAWLVREEAVGNVPERVTRWPPTSLFSLVSH